MASVCTAIWIFFSLNLKTGFHTRDFLCSGDMSHLSQQCSESHCNFDILLLIRSLCSTWFGANCFPCLLPHLAVSPSQETRSLIIKMSCWFFLSFCGIGVMFQRNLSYPLRQMLKHHFSHQNFLKWALEVFQLQENLFPAEGVWFGSQHHSSFRFQISHNLAVFFCLFFFCSLWFVVVAVSLFH